MFFEQPEIIKILQSEYKWSSDDIKTMQYEYTNSIVSLIIKETISYIEKYNLPDLAGLNALLQQSKPTRGELETEIKLVRFVAALPGKYPKLELYLKKKIRELDDSLATDLTSGLSEEAGLKILKIIEQDLNSIEAYQQMFLKQNS